uniref:ARAD1B08668p n=1 Tax=Blastobotrys adeninivorans TaxID=409370 RepID=A0A060TBK6_BLAAD
MKTPGLRLPRRVVWPRLIHTSRIVRAQFPEPEHVISKFTFPPATHSIKQVNLLQQDKEGTKVTLHGWVHLKPRKVSKRLVFATLRDPSGETIQLVDANEPLFLRTVKPETAICVQGTYSSANGTKEIRVTSAQVLNEAGLIGSQLTTGETKEWPPEHRYLELRQPRLQDMLKRRAALVKACRDSLDSQGFTEIETPVLFKSTPEGAREFLVPTRRKGYMYALPQSPQQYKQLLMASGVKAYYQVARCFRDEDLRQDRQPEFTQLDMEMSFATGEEVREVVEKVIGSIFTALEDGKKNLYTMDTQTGHLKIVDPSSPKFDTLTYSQAMSRFGIDKPDLRSSLEITQLCTISHDQYGHPVDPAVQKESTHSQKGHPQPKTIVEALVLKQAKYDQADLDHLRDANNYSGATSVPKVVEVTSENETTWYKNIQDHIQSSFHETVQNQCSELTDKDSYISGDNGVNGSTLLSHISASSFTAFDVRPGDIIAISVRKQDGYYCYENPTPLGRLRQLAIEKFPQYRRPGLTGDYNEAFCANWVIDFPLFQPQDADDPSLYSTNLACTHHPFTMVHPTDYPLLQHSPLASRGLHYDLVINGVEVGGGSTRVHDEQLQRYILENILGVDNAESLFGHLLRALGAGCPPHAGLAIGLDRLVAMMCRTTSIRNVMAFPKTVTGQDPLVGSPSLVKNNALSPYHLNMRSEST